MQVVSSSWEGMVVGDIRAMPFPDSCLATQTSRRSSKSYPRPSLVLGFRFWSGRGVVFQDEEGYKMFIANPMMFQECL